MKRPFFEKKILVKIFTLFVILNFNVFAKTYTWNGSVSSDWNDAGNWDTTDTSTMGYNIILAPGSYYDVDFTTRNTMDFDSLVVKSGVEIKIDTDISVTNNFTNSGTVSVIGTGFIISCGSLENNGSFDFGSNQVDCGSLQNSGTLSFTEAGTLSVTNDATFSGDFTNTGTISVGNALTFEEDLINNGTITAGTGDFTVNGDYSGNGKLTLSSGTSTFKGESVDFSGTMLTHNGGTIIFANEGSGGLGGFVNNYGEVSLTVDTTVFNNVQIGTDDKAVKINVTGNFTVEGNFSSTNPTNVISQQQTSTYKGITFSGTGKAILFAGKNTIEQIQVTGTDNTITFASGNVITNMSVTANSNTITFSEDNTIGTLTLNGESIIAKFGAEKTQTISNLTVNGVSGNEIFLTTTAASPSVADTTTWWNIAGLTSDKVSISNAKIEYSASEEPLMIYASDVTENTAGSTENWFLREFYWFGKTDTKWSIASNWSSSADSYEESPIAPPSDSGLSEIQIVKNDTNILFLESDINVKSFVVNQGSTVDFASCSVTSTNGISNAGTIRLQGSSGQNLSNPSNKENSTIEYYGNTTALSWKIDYENVIFAEGVAGVFSGITVDKDTKIINGTGNVLSLNGTFAGKVILGDGTKTAGQITITSGNDVNLRGTCDSLIVNADVVASEDITATGDISITGTSSVENITSQSGAISFTGDATASGAISASGDISFNANANINEVTSTDGAISVTGTTSASGNITSAKSQTFNGAFTLQDDITLLAKNNTITFSNTVNGTYALTIGDNANATNVTFEKSVGSTNKLAFLDVKGDVTANGAISTTGNISIGGTATVSGVTSQTGAISFNGDTKATGTISATGDISFGGVATVTEVSSTGGAISFDKNAIASGAISASGDISFKANAIINEVTSQSGAISVTGTTSASGNITSAKSQTFNGAFTLQDDITLLAKNNTITFSDTVNGTHALTIGNNANTTNVIFAKGADSTDTITTLSVKGNVTANGAISTTGNISIGGAATVTEVTSGTGVITVGGDTKATGAISASGAISFGGVATVAGVTSQNGAISFDKNATASGAILASGDISFNANATINEVTSQSGAISVTGTTSASGNITSAKSQTFNGAFTLQKDITFVANKVSFNGTVDSKAGSNCSATFGNETVKTSASFNFRVGSSVPLGDITLNAATFSDNASLIQTEASSLNVNGDVTFGKAQLQLGNLNISAGASFIQTGVNTETQSVGTIKNEETLIWDSSELGGSITLNGDITGSNAQNVVFNKKNVSINNNLSIAGVFYDMTIPQDKTVTNASGLCVRNNFTVNGTYTHNDKKLTLGKIIVEGKEYPSGANGKISGNANVNFGTVEIVQQTTPKNIAISGSISELIMNDSGSTGKISISSNANTNQAFTITTIQNADGTQFALVFAKNITFENAPTINTKGIVSFENDVTSSEKIIFQNGISIPKANKITAKGNLENTAGTVDFARPVELTGNTIISANNINFASSVELNGKVTISAKDASFSDLNLNTYDIDLTTTKLCFNKNVVSDTNAQNTFTLKNSGSAEIKDGVQISCGQINFTGNEEGTSSVSAINLQLESLAGNVSINNERFASSATITIDNANIFIIDEKSEIKCTNLVQSGSGKNQLAGQFVISENATFNTDVFVTDEFTISATNLVVGNASSKDLFINAIKNDVAKNVEFACDIQSQNFVLLNGNVTLSGNLAASKDIVLQNGIASAIYKDSESVAENLLAYFNSARNGKTALCSLQAFPEKNPDGTDISLTAFASSFGGFAGKTISAGQNFYSNGVDLVPNAKWTLSLKKNDVATSAFAEFHNGKLKNCDVVCNSGTAYLSCAENSVDEGANSGAFFGRPNFSVTGTYTVYDNVIRVEFVDSVLGTKATIENSNNEISKAILSGKFVHLGNAGKTSFEGTYVDSECNVSTDGKGDLDVFYIKTEQNWNSDATGNSAGDSESTDWSGVHRTAIPYIDLPKALSSLYETLRDNHKNRIAHYYDTNAFTDVKDKCSPVLIGIRTGQELHKNNTGTASSQMPYDAHNFIEFQYSESVNTASILLNDKDDLSKTMNVQVTSDFGEIISSAEGLNIAGIAKIQSGKIKTGSTDSSVPNTKIHSLYRNFAVNANAAEKFQSHRMRVGIASFVDKTVLANGKEFHHWVGYIDEATTPSGAVIPLESKIVDDKKLIYDAQGNSLDVKGTQTHSLLDLSVAETDVDLYGSWDVYAPVFAEYKSSLDNTAETKYAEAIGTSSAGYSTLDKIEFHLHDNKPSDFAEDVIWFNKVGWCSDAYGKVLYKSFTDATDIFGGARAFDDNAQRRTAGGIRYSSLYDKADFFKYSTDVSASEINTAFDSMEIKGGAKSLIFIPPVGNRKSTGAEDGLYFSVYLKDKTLPLKSTFVICYDENACVTDLAGNRLRNRTLNTIDRVSPKFNISVAEVKNNKLYVVFNKKLNVQEIAVYQETSSSDIEAKRYPALQKITESLRIVDKSWNPSTEIQIDTTVPAEYVFSNEFFTGLIFTLTKDVKYSDVKNFYLQAYAPETSMDPLSGIPGANVTYVQDNIGNYMAHKEAHALSDFAVGIVNPIFAYDNRQLSDEDYFSKGIYGKILGAEESYSVHDWNDEQNNYGTLVTGQDIFISANLADGTNDNSDLPAKIVGYFDIYKNNNFVSIDQDSLSCEYNESIMNADAAMLPWRIWLPEKVSDGSESPVFKALSNKNNAFDLFVTGVKEESEEDEQITKMNFLLPYDNESENIVHASSSMKNCGWDKGQQISFLFGLENEDGSPVQICHAPEYNESTDSYTCDMSPLFALRLKNPRDLTSLDLWSFKLQTVSLQRGGISVLNNVINASNNEKAIVQVDMSNSGNLNIAVMTLDGNIVQYLHKGSLEKGTHYFSWNGRTKGNKTVARGLYFVRVFGSGIDETRKIMVVKD